MSWGSLAGLAAFGVVAFVAGAYPIALGAMDPEGRGLGDLATYAALAGVALGALCVAAAVILGVVHLFT